MKEKRITYKGTCQICGGIYTLAKDSFLIKAHESPKAWRFLAGGCDGSNHRPFELDCELVKNSINSLGVVVEDLKQQAEKIRSNKSNIVLRNDNSGTKVPFELTPENKHMWRRDTECSNLNEAIETYNDWNAGSLEGDAEKREAYIDWQLNRLKGWKETALLTTKDKEEIKAAGRNKTAAVRKAKKEVAEIRMEGSGVNNYWDNNDSDGTNWFYQQFLDQRAESVELARQAFLLGSKGLIYRVHEPKIEEFEIYSFQEFQKHFRKTEGFPLLSCLNCNGRLFFELGELWCHRTHNFTFDSQRKIAHLSMIAKSLRRGDQIVHLYTYSTTDRKQWHDISHWRQAYEILKDPDISDIDVYCSLCKAPIKMNYASIKCECQSNEVNSTEAVEDNSKSSQSIFSKIGDFGHNLLSSFSGQKEAIPFEEFKNHVYEVQFPDLPEGEEIDDTDSINEWMSEVTSEPQIDLLQLSPDNLPEFENWLVSMGLCDAYSKKPSLVSTN